MKAVIDSREPRNVKDQAAIEFEANEHETSVEELPQGDFYYPEKDVIVERKDSADFASSTTKGRLSDQADRMVAEHDYSFVVIENDIKDGSGGNPPTSLYNLKYSNASANTLIGMQTSLAVKRGIYILYTESPEHTCYAVRRLFERFEQSEHEDAGGGHVKTADTGAVDDIDVKILTQIKGISPKKAQKIVEQVGEVSHISWHITSEKGDTQGIRDSLRQIDGIGRTLTNRVVEVFK